MEKIIKYFDSEIEVKEGDHVLYKGILIRWKWKPGRISYVPGVSKYHPEMEHNRLCWVGVSGDDGTFRGILVDPETYQIQKTIKYVERSKDG